MYEERLLVDLVKRPGCLLVANEGGDVTPAAAHVPISLAARAEAWLSEGESGIAAARREEISILTAVELASSYDEKLRKKAAPYALRVSQVAIPQIEALLFGASYKGVTDFVTKYLWPAPARRATKWCAERKLTPNLVTTISALCVVLATVLFAEAVWLPGLALAWMMTFLDTVDGKLARVTLTSSKWGNIFDHGVDLVHPPFWYYAWWVGLGRPESSLLIGSLWIIVAGYVVGRLMEGFFLAVYKMEIHAWRPVDSQFRLITARRNPNLALLTMFSLVAAPESGFVAVAIWTIASTVFHTVRILQAVAGQIRGNSPRSWLIE
ncbi:MAG: CDP-alcohol phosphatidyltransferase family protein [Myxococcales bacterium]|nr:MAG: CDP-alcohol phosphatidyltransferase family protein [Myxococcales bacterium]